MGFFGLILYVGEVLCCVMWNGDFLGIRVCMLVGVMFMFEELVVLDVLDCGDRLWVGLRDFVMGVVEMVVCWCWLYEWGGWMVVNVWSVLVEMMGVMFDVIKVWLNCV